MTTSSSSTLAPNNTIQEGTYVLLQDLNKAAEFNGKLALVRDEPEETGGRYTVRMCASPCQVVNVKLANLSPACAADQDAQLGECYQVMSAARLADLCQAASNASEGLNKQALIKLALERRVFPEPSEPPSASASASGKKQKQKKEAAAAASQSGEDDVTLPDGKVVKRQQLWDQADQMERMTPQQMKQQLAMFKSKSPHELRNSQPQLRQVSDLEFQQQIAQLEQFIANPRAKRTYLDALRSGDFSQLTGQQAQASQPTARDDAVIKREARERLALFREDKLQYREQYGSSPLVQALSDDALEQRLVQHADSTTTAQQLREARMHEAVSALTDEQLVQNSRAQLKMFNDNPKQARKQMGPQVAAFTDDQIRSQLEMAAAMSASELRNVQAMQQQQGSSSSSSPAAMAAAPQQAMENMTGEQLKAMFKMQRDLLKRDPAQFRRMMPAGATMGMSDEALLTQLDTMAEMDGDALKQYMSMTSQFQGVFSQLRAPFDKVTGGRGHYVLLALVALLVLMLTYGASVAIGRLLAMLFPTTFGSAAAASAASATLASEQAAAAAAAAAGAAGTAYVQDDQEFVQHHDEDL